jgi:hypothetical protein
MADCESCCLALPPDAYPWSDEVVLERYHGWCTQCIRDDQAREHGLAASVLRNRATLRRTIALAVDDRVVSA